MSLNIAIPKGYLKKDCISFIKKAGYDVSNLVREDRKLFVYSQKDDIKYIISRPMDVPVYVEYGACDLGFVGKDVLLEKESNVYELLDLESGKCRLIIATRKDCTQKVRDHYQHFGSIRIATKYPNITKKYFDKKGMQVEIIKLHGSVELGPILGIAEEILDITATGQTLRENDLVEMENVMVSTTRLVANMVSYRTKYDRIDSFVNGISKAIKEEESGKKN
ncbi:MAG: ATP phosphoribosyltransferase [Candidatus Humimicrobiaceae bacterium]